MTEERRNHRRQVYQLAVRVRLDSIDQLIDEYARDISIGGMSLRLDNPVDIGEKIYLEFRLLESAPLISVFAKVKWSFTHDGKHVVGVEFLDLDDAGKQFIEQILVYIQERRLHRRVASNHTVSITSPTIEDFARAYAQDISTSGAKLIVNKAMQVGTELTLSINLEGGKKLAQVASEVRWCEPRMHGFAIGVEFTNVDDNSKQFIADIVEYN